MGFVFSFEKLLFCCLRGVSPIGSSDIVIQYTRRVTVRCCENAVGDLTRMKEKSLDETG